MSAKQGPACVPSLCMAISGLSLSSAVLKERVGCKGGFLTTTCVSLPRDLVKLKEAGLHPGVPCVSDRLSLGWVLRICISNKFLPRPAAQWAGPNCLSNLSVRMGITCTICFSTSGTSCEVLHLFLLFLFVCLCWGVHGYTYTWTWVCEHICAYV